MLAARCTWGLIVFFALLFFFRLSSAPLWYTDEYKGAERSREFLETGDLFVVRQNFQPNFHKPPLHYWLTASTLRLLGEGKLAIRFWAWLFAIATLALTASYTRLVAPGLPMAAPLAMAMVGLYGPFLQYAQIGILDAGLMFWTLAVLWCSELAQTEEKWWIAAGLCAGLGSLYKVPLPLAVWAIWLLVRARDPRAREIMMRSGWLRVGTVLAVLLTASWPALQIFLHRGAWWGEYIREEGISLLVRSNEGTYGAATYLVWLLLKWWLFGLAALLGTGWILYKGRVPDRDGPAVRLYEAAIIAAAFLVGVSLVQSKSQRYLLPVIPLFAVAGSVFFLGWRTSANRRAVLLLAGLVPVLAGFRAHYLKNKHGDLTADIATARRFGAAGVSADFLFSIDGVEDPAFLLFFGRLHQPVYPMPEPLAVMMHGSWHGLISSCDWPRLKADAPGTRLVADDGQVVEFVRD